MLEEELKALASRIGLRVEQQIHRDLRSLHLTHDDVAQRAGQAARDAVLSAPRIEASGMEGAAEVFDALAVSRRRLDPRRLMDRWHARAIRKLIQISLEAYPEPPQTTSSEPTPSA